MDNAQITCIGGNMYLEKSDLQEVNQILKNNSINVISVEGPEFIASIFDSFRVVLDDSVLALIINTAASVSATEIFQAIKFIFLKYKYKISNYSFSKRQPTHLTFQFKSSKYGSIETHLTTNISDELSIKALEVLLDTVKQGGVPQPFPTRDFVVETDNSNTIEVISIKDYYNRERIKNQKSNVLRKEEYEKNDSLFPIQDANKKSYMPTYKMIQEYVS